MLTPTFMARIWFIALFITCSLFAQTPDITGVWNADLTRSKIGGVPIKSYLAIITKQDAVVNRRTQEKAPQITDLSGALFPFGEERETLQFFINGKPSMGPFEGIPARLTGTVGANSITVSGEIAGEPDRFTRTYTLSPDGQTLTLHISGTAEGRSYDNTYVLLKQTDAAGNSLRQPEEHAGQHFKNVKTEAMKSLPVSEFIDDMRYFAWSLGKDCEFCHVEHHFDSDEKKEKKTARKMIDMTAAIDQNHFEGHPAVRCFTCHQRNDHPRRFPTFADQTAPTQSEQPPAGGQQ